MFFCVLNISRRYSNADGFTQTTSSADNKACHFNTYFPPSRQCQDKYMHIARLLGTLEYLLLPPLASPIKISPGESTA